MNVHTNELGIHQWPSLSYIQHIRKLKFRKVRGLMKETKKVRNCEDGS